ncbi:unnamed protein product [Adineta steineri]|uniref:Uncharacterized protein n=1 Tax=Adineta steineri TaxID=433720 RepID=A0A815GHD2_9BILA|nr:unnamed protein product [Adineta steineri]CAF1592151.1 unnamed protein product [Adineta steineri]
MNRSYRSLSSHCHRQLHRSQRNQSSSPPPPPPPEPPYALQQQSYRASCLRAELAADDALIQEIQILIHRFLIRHSRRLPYHMVINCSDNGETIPDYIIMLKIDRSSSSSLGHD